MGIFFHKGLVRPRPGQFRPSGTESLAKQTFLFPVHALVIHFRKGVKLVLQPHVCLIFRNSGIRQMDKLRMQGKT